MRKSVPSVITKLIARQILDSRGIPTVEVDLHTNKGVFRASTPSGVSSGMYEAIEIRDGDKASYLGNGVTKAVKNINEKISETLIGMYPTLQSQIDQAMIDLDKTEKKSNRVKYNLTPEIIHQIFAEKPAVRRAYLNLVLKKMTETDFWMKYWRAEYLHSTKNIVAAAAEAAEDEELAVFLKQDDI